MAGPTTSPRNAALSPQEAVHPDRIIVISDLHMGAGVRADERADPLEHFFQDEAFVRLLEALARRAARTGRHYGLVFNGDVFDFVRTVRLPSPAEVPAWRALLEDAGVASPAGALADAAADRYSAVERRYGFDATEHEAVWKLLAMAQGHPRIFESLARWCRAGHELVILRGNHDVELAWPGVRRAMRVLIQRAGGAALRPRQLRFRMQCLRLQNLHIEHGHAIRWSTHVDGRFTGGAVKRLKQPIGSYINRFVLNPIERLTQLAPGVTASSHMKNQLRNEPFRLWRGLLRHAFRAMPPLGRAAWRAWYRRAHGWWPTRIGNGLALGVLALPLLSPELLAALALDSLHTLTGAALLAFATPHLGLAFLETLATVRDDTRRKAREHARRRAARLRGSGRGGERIVVLGHTHRAEVAHWRDARGPVRYANPGCWLGQEVHERARPRFAWCARRGRSYTRARVLEYTPEMERCRTASKR